MSSMRNKLVLASAAVTLPPLIILGWYGGSRIEGVLRSDGLERLEARISGLSAQVERYLAGVDGDLLLLADTPALAQYLLASDSGDTALIDAARKNLSLAFVRLSEIRGNYYQIRYIDSSGAERLRVDRDKDVTVVVAPDKLETRRSTPDFTSALKLPKGEVMISPVELNREKGTLEDTPRPLLRYSTSVFDNTSRRRGVLIIGVSVDPILKLIASAPEKGETLFVADSGGAYLSHPNSAKLFGSDRDLATGENLTKDYPELGPKLLAATELYKDEGKDVLTLARPIPIPGVTRGGLGVLVDQMPTEILYAKASGLRTVFNWLTLLALVLALGFGLIVAQWVTGPIIKLTQAVERMSKGDLDSPIESVSDDETQKLASAMERLRKSMKLMIDKLSEE
ncbi:MAG TPA: cache and HAMP domain-containing protein [Candidatus Limnocylindrales bacterium]|nr:cache and HAMP domain-containing protein [Candidatus Limnocylindrales bacterium]